jgi:hypothetical protein
MKTEVSELIDLFFTLQSRLHFFWNFYFATVLALLAFIGSSSSGVLDLDSNYPLKISITIIFVLFVIGNFHGLWMHARMTKAALSSLCEVVEHDPNSSKPAQIVVNGMAYILRREARQNNDSSPQRLQPSFRLNFSRFKLYAQVKRLNLLQIGIIIGHSLGDLIVLAAKLSVIQISRSILLQQVFQRSKHAV